MGLGKGVGYADKTDAEFYKLIPSPSSEVDATMFSQSEIDDFMVTMFSEGLDDKEVTEKARAFFGMKNGLAWTRDWKRRNRTALMKFIWSARDADTLRRHAEMIQSGVLSNLIKLDETFDDIVKQILLKAETPEDFERASRVAAQKIKAMKPLLELASPRGDVPLVNIELSRDKDKDLFDIVDKMFTENPGTDPIDAASNAIESAKTRKLPYASNI